MKLRGSIIAILLFSAFLSVTALKAQDGLRGAFSVGTRTTSALAGPPPQIAAADFDNDQRPDGALLQEAGILNGQRAFRIEIHLTAGANDSIAFSSNESGLAISALDVNHDGAPDIVIEKTFTHERLQVYLNDGHGTFHKVRAEDYPASHPASSAWRVWLNQIPPIFGFPLSRGFDIGTARRVTVIRGNRSASFRFWCDGLLIQSAARAPSSSRAPPSISL